MLIEQEVSGDIEELNNLFKHSPQKTELAIKRTMRKLGNWTERQVLRELAGKLTISQKILKDIGRIKTKLIKTGTGAQYLTVWIGTIPVGAHKFGKASQTAKGVRVGRHSFWKSSFLMKPVNAQRDMIWQRDSDWTAKWRKSKVSGRWMWMGLSIHKKVVPIHSDAEAAVKKIEPKIFNRFSTLLHQELNYVFNIES